MNLELFFEPIDVEKLKLDLKSDSFYHSLYIYEESLPRWQNMDIAIFGVNEYRGQNTEINSNAADKVRKKLYTLKQQKNSLKVIDLGNLRLGNSLDDTVDRISEVCKILIDENVLPLIIGGSHDLDLGQFKAYQNIESELRVLMVDSCIDIYEEGYLHEKHSRQILLHDPNFLFNFTHVAHQTYLNHPHSADTLEKLNCDHIRLGEISKGLASVEPYIRFAQMISFDLNAIKQSDFSSNFNPQPFGLNAEDACQICWYSGMSNSCSSFGLYGYYPELDGRLQGASVIAVMAWYFIDGFYNRPKLIYTSKDYKKYIVECADDSFIFYKDLHRDMWWVQLEISSSKKEIIPCSYDDYLEATKGEIPQRLYNFKMKFVK